MSEPDLETGGEAAGFRMRTVATDIVEIGAFRNGGSALAQVAAARSIDLPALGRITRSDACAVLCVRPDTWLLLTDPAAPGVAAGNWHDAVAPHGGAVDLSSGLVVFELSGPNVRDVLARNCRLDLHPDMFTPGQAAAAGMAQVHVVLAATGTGFLLLVPATYARHMAEWLASSARPFGVQSLPSITLGDLPP